MSSETIAAGGEVLTRTGPDTVITARGTALRAVDAWGTVITLEAAPADGIDAASLLAAAEPVMDDCEAEIARIDRLFSTYREDSVITALRREPGLESGLGWTGDHLDVHLVLEECRAARSLTGGLFDPWSLEEGLDPSGYVKGWGAGRIAKLLVDGLGASRTCGVCVNAGGDVSVRGSESDGTPWSIGVRDPDDAGTILRIITATQGHVATSGLYERGAHVVDPRDGSRPQTGDGRLAARQATVWGPDDGLADAFATALLLGGREAAGAFEELRVSDVEAGRPSRWGAYVVEDGRVWRLGETDALADPGRTDRLDAVVGSAQIER